GSLWDLAEAPTLGELPGTVQRTALTAGAWIDLRPGWWSGATEVFDALVSDVDWRAERRQMYDRVLDVPRLTRFYGERERLPHPLLARAREALS
ncbi:hypothetical protein ACTGWY_11210, partial [Streptococcus suis]